MINSYNPNLEVDLCVIPNCELITYDNTNYNDSPEEGGEWTDYAMIECFTKKDIASTVDEIWLDECLINPIVDNWYADKKYFQSKITIAEDGTYNYYKLIVRQSDLGKAKVLNYFWDRELEQWTAPYSFSTILFTICHLETYLIKLQKKYIEKYQFRSCINSKDAMDLKNQRDFILDSTFVLKYLISLQNYTEAQRILNNLNQYNLVYGDIANYSSGCGCGRTV